MQMAQDAVATLIADELRIPAGPAAVAMAEHCRQLHGNAVSGVLFYGSCLRQPEQPLTDSLLDFYVLVDDYEAAYDNRLLAWANALLPPNVFYVECPWNGSILRAKYAVMSMRQFAFACSNDALNVSIWARFCQPARLVWRRSDASLTALAIALAEACRTMLSNAWPSEPGTRMPRLVDPLEVWEGGFAQTYAAELRAESGNRAQAIVRVDAERYRRIGKLIEAELRSQGLSQENRWARRRLVGKTLNYLRLVKAIFTFEGGIDYIMWKVKRHSGIEIPVSNWQRRHPFLSAPGLAWKLYRRGAFR